MPTALEEQVKTLGDLQEGVFNRVIREHLFFVYHHAEKTPLAAG